MSESEKIQDLTSRIGGLDLALRVTLERLAELHGNGASQDIEALRDDLVKRWKNSGIPADRELDHAKVTRPAIEVTEVVFNSVLDELRKGGDQK